MATSDAHQPPDDPEQLRAMLLDALRERDDVTRERDDWKLKHDEARAERDRQLAELAKVDGERAKADAERAAALRRNDELELKLIRAPHQLLQMQRWYYGRKADALSKPEDVAQLVLDFARQIDALPEPQVDDAEAIADDGKPLDLRDVELPGVRAIRRGRRNLADAEFDKLPVVRQEHDLPDEQKPCPCCGERRVKIGSESSWQLEYVPAEGKPYRSVTSSGSNTSA